MEKGAHCSSFALTLPKQSFACSLPARQHMAACLAPAKAKAAVHIANYPDKLAAAAFFKKPCASFAACELMGGSDKFT